MFNLCDIRKNLFQAFLELAREYRKKFLCSFLRNLKIKVRLLSRFQNISIQREKKVTTFPPFLFKHQAYGRIIVKLQKSNCSPMLTSIVAFEEFSAPAKLIGSLCQGISPWRKGVIWNNFLSGFKMHYLPKWANCSYFLPITGLVFSSLMTEANCLDIFYSTIYWHLV